MKYLLSYPLALIWGLYFYLLFQLVFWVRFGHVNGSFDEGTFALYLVGVGSILLCQYLSRRRPGHELGMTVAFVVGVPFAFIGALFGGLFGAFGVVLLGLVPFAIALPLGHWVIGMRAHA